MGLPAQSRRPGGGTSPTNTSTYSSRKVRMYIYILHIVLYIRIIIIINYTVYECYVYIWSVYTGMRITLVLNNSVVQSICWYTIYLYIYIYIYIYIYTAVMYM